MSEASEAITPECSLCWAPLRLPPEKRTPGYRFCSRYCRELLGEIGWEESKGNPRGFYLKHYDPQAYKIGCDICDHPTLPHISGICGSCKTVYCGVCILKADNDNRTCVKCNNSLTDQESLLEYFENIKNPYPRRLVAGRILAGIFQFNSENGGNVEKKEARLLLKQLADMGDLQADYILLSRKGPPKETDEDELKHYLHLAILGHAKAQDAVSCLWSAEIYDGADCNEKSDFWLNMSAANGDKKALVLKAERAKSGGKMEEFDFYLRKAAKHGCGSAYSILGDRAKGPLAIKYYEKGKIYGSDYCKVILAISKAEGRNGMKKNFTDGHNELVDIFEKIQTKKGNKGNELAREWFTINYYQNKAIVSPTCLDVQKDQKLALELLEEGVSLGDKNSMIMLSKILGTRKTNSEKKRSMELARSVFGNGVDFSGFEKYFSGTKDHTIKIMF